MFSLTHLFRLRQLYAQEQAQLQKEIDECVETPQQLRERLEAKAQVLREKRIQRRNDFVEKQRLKQFR